MSFEDFITDDSGSYGRDRAFINAVEDVFPSCWDEGRTRPYQLLSVIEQYLETHGPDAATRYRRARLDVARAYDVTERTISRSCEDIYDRSSREQFVADLETFENRLNDE